MNLKLLVIQIALFGWLAQSAIGQPPDLVQRGNRAPPDGAAASLDSAKVAAAIKRGVSYLKRSQNPRDGGWREKMPQNCGVTALVTLALLNCGEDPESPEILRALNYLRAKKPEATYSVALQCMVFCALTRKSKEDFPIIERNCRWLASKQLTNGGWSYPSNSSGDPSNSQFALLALHEGQRAGAKLADDEKSNVEAWKKCLTNAEAYWHELQLTEGVNSGGFSYDNNQARGSMTCAGIASLIITASQLDSLEAQAVGETCAMLRPGRRSQRAHPKSHALDGKQL